MHCPPPDHLAVKKPWGHEYLVYENEHVELWFLRINHGQSTSMHCHPIKTTGLILLDGEIKLSFLADFKYVKSLDKAMLRRGLFHRTEAISTDGAFLFEVETPKDKNDLIRLNDRYGRSASPYENETINLPDLFHISEPSIGHVGESIFCNCRIAVESVTDVSVINGKNDKDILVFLNGGIVKHVGGEIKFACIPGDVGFGAIVKNVASQLDGVAPGTMLMTISKL